MGQRTSQYRVGAESKRQEGHTRIWSSSTIARTQQETSLHLDLKQSAPKTWRLPATSPQLHQTKVNGWKKQTANPKSAHWESHGCKEQAGKHASAGEQSLGLQQASHDSRNTCFPAP